MSTPVSDLGKISNRLNAGDTIHIAAGVYLGRGGSGSDVIRQPVSIIGGYDRTFAKRDPWGGSRTVLSGENTSSNWKPTPRLMIDLLRYRGKEMPPIVIDGIIVDDSSRNSYLNGGRIVSRRYSPKLGSNASPTQGGIVVRVSRSSIFDTDVRWEITVQNCLVSNSASRGGALSVSGHQGSIVTVRNNLVINNTGAGIHLGSKFSGTPRPLFTVENNTVLFTWKYDAMTTTGSGSAIRLDRHVDATLKNNVFGFSDRYGIDNARSARASFTGNQLGANVAGDCLDFDTRLMVDDLPGESNRAATFEVPISSVWTRDYASRNLVDRNALEADIKAQKTIANEIRGLFGLPLSAGTAASVESPVWMHKLPLSEATEAAGAIKGAGCVKP